eukprot:UN28410
MVDSLTMYGIVTYVIVVIFWSTFHSKFLDEKKKSRASKLLQVMHFIQTFTSSFIALPVLTNFYISYQRFGLAAFQAESFAFTWSDFTGVVMALCSARNWTTLEKDWFHYVDVGTILMTVTTIFGNHYLIDTLTTLFFPLVVLAFCTYFLGLYFRETQSDSIFLYAMCHVTFR